MLSVAAVLNFLFDDDAFFDENAANQATQANKEPVCDGTILYALPRLADDETWAYPEIHPFRAPGTFAPSHARAPRPLNSVGHAIRVQQWSGYRRPVYQSSSPSSAPVAPTLSLPEATHPGVPCRVERRPRDTTISDSVSSSSSSGTESGYEGPRTPGPVDRLAEKLERAMSLQEWEAKTGYSPVAKVQEIALPRIHSPKPFRPIHLAAFEAMLNESEETEYDGDVDEYDLEG